MIRLYAFFLLISVCSSVSGQDWKTMRTKADSLYTINLVTAAVIQLRKATDLAKQDESAGPATIDSMEAKLSDIYTQLWKFGDAEPLNRKIIIAGEKGGELYIHSLTNLGLACLYGEKFDSAYSLFEQSDALAINTSAGNKFLHAENLMGLSRFYTAMGKLDSALISCTEAASLYAIEKDKWTSQYSLAIALAIHIYLAENDYLNAKKMVKESLISLNTPDIRKWSNPYYNEVMLLAAEFSGMTKDFKNAQLAYITLAFYMLKDLGEDNPLSATLFNNYGYSCLQNDKPAEAKKQFLRALRSLDAQGMSESMMYMSTKNNLGTAYLSASEYLSADSIYASAEKLIVSKWGTEHFLRGQMEFNMALSFAAQDKFDQAAKAYATAGSITRSQLMRDISGMSEKEQLGVYNISEINFQALPSFLHLNKSYRNDSVNLALFADQSFVKGLISFNQQRSFSQLRNSGDESIKERLNQWKQNRQTLATAYSMSRNKKFVDSLSAATIVLERALKVGARSILTGEEELNVSYTSLSNKLKKGETAIEFFKYHLYNKVWTDTVIYAALIVKPGSTAPVFVDLCTEADLLKVIHPYYSDEINKNTLHALYKDPRTRKAGVMYGNDYLYNLVWKPLEKELKNSTRIFLSPVGLINLVAFHALPYNNSQLLSDRYEINRLQRLADLVKDTVRSDNSVMNVELWGGIDYGPAPAGDKMMNKQLRGSEDGWIPLDYTRKEIAGIEQNSKPGGMLVNVHAEKNATRETFLATPFTKPTFLHIATHGFYTRDSSEMAAVVEGFYTYNNVRSKDPLLRSGLVMAGANQAIITDTALALSTSILTSYDIASMNLENVKLATLSACETAMGDMESGEGVFGLQRALKLAGVNKMILTLWPVNDRQTQGFMVTLYKKLNAGATVRQAFLATQREMRKTNAPEFWAGFILVE